MVVDEIARRKKQQERLFKKEQERREIRSQSRVSIPLKLGGSGLVVSSFSNHPKIDVEIDLFSKRFHEHLENSRKILSEFIENNIEGKINKKPVKTKKLIDRPEKYFTKQPFETSSRFQVGIGFFKKEIEAITSDTVPMWVIEDIASKCRGAADRMFDNAEKL